MADAGRAMMLYRGLYDSTRTYEKLDVVNHNGSLYISTTDGNLGTKPTDGTKWKLFLQGGVADNIRATDTKGLVGEAGSSSFVQLLLDSLASRIGKDGNGDVIEDTYVQKSNVLNTEEEIDANTSEGNIAGALAVKKISSDLKNKLDKAIILSNTSVNEVYETGIYFSTSWLDSPFIIDKQGTLICINYTGNVGSGWFLQIFISPYFSNVKVRNHQESLFGDWVESIYKDDMDKKFDWSQIASFAEDGTLTTQDIVGYKEFLIMYGFLYDISVTHIIPASIFRGLEGAGIYTGDAIVRYVSDTSIQVDNLPENYRLRIFGR